MKHPICDYEGSDYKAFWQGRDYEDAAERIAMGRLLPPRGDLLVEVGAGFGRWADLYRGYGRVILVDYAKSQLLEASKRLGEGFTYLAADIYQLPLADSAFDVAVTVRLLHHLSHIPDALREIHRILKPQGSYILEYSNKRNLKEILRYLVGRSRKRPFSPEPVKYMEMHFNFHPAYMRARLEEAGFALQRELSVSQFRWPPLKALLPPHILARLDGSIQGAGGRLKLGPSIFVAARARKEGSAMEGSPFLCPICQGSLEEREALLLCGRCGREWKAEEGVYDLRQG